MPFTIRYARDGIEQPPIEKSNAHEAGQQILYLKRDGYAVQAIVDPQGNEISHEQLGNLALKSLSGR